MLFRFRPSARLRLHSRFANYDISEPLRMKPLDFLENKDGTMLQRRVWEETLKMAEKLVPGCAEAAGLQ